MSHDIGEYYDVYSENRRKARKPHACDACSEPVAVGDYYWTIFIVFDDTTETVKRCVRCQTIHEHLRSLAPGDMWPAEKLDCGIDYDEHWNSEPPPEIAALAFRTAAELQADVRASLKR